MSVTIKSKSAQGKESALVASPRKWLLGLAGMAAIGVSYVMIQGGVMLYQQYQQVTHPKSLIYGTWVEYDVAPYRADRLVISAAGITIDGGVVDTDFQFDGEFLTYQHGSQERRFKFQYENWNEMTLQTDNAYQPVFVKSPSN
ncbi:DUF2850 domain-containing protein [Vibrio rhodolitus]|uniref:DUF2850 domain-containing protein n=1 Tax=Vibrio rhodolitus TaxID=2231649 RepID=UPI000E0C52CC|nr:DUF2850 domain-containing protein [Vibrio rhodolitus]